uniref:Uncharacterized protein n=1 Tax=Rhinopithecus bieti TaxID=61621 RepID=A0A2K6LW51_RHIBE
MQCHLSMLVVNMPLAPGRANPHGMCVNTSLVSFTLRIQYLCSCIWCSLHVFGVCAYPLCRPRQDPGLWAVVPSLLLQGHCVLLRESPCFGSNPGSGRQVVGVAAFSASLDDTHQERAWLHSSLALGWALGHRQFGECVLMVVSGVSLTLSSLAVFLIRVPHRPTARCASPDL